MSSFKASSGGSKINREGWGRPDLVAVHVKRAWDLGDSKLFMSYRVMATRAGVALGYSNSLNEEGLPHLRIQCWEPEVGRPWQTGPDPEAMDVEL